MISLELSEKKRHGTSGFPIEYYFIDESHPRYVMNLHWHKEFEIIRVLSGKLSAYLNNERYELQEGDCLFVGGGSLIRAEPENCVYDCVVFDLNMLKKGEGDALSRYPFPDVNGKVSICGYLSRDHRCIYDTVDRLMKCLKEQRDFYELAVYSMLYELFYRLYKEGYIKRVNEVPQNKKLRKISSILEWINNNYTSDISLEVLSNIHSISEKYLCRIFKEYTSKTITEYISELRIENACLEITKGGKSVTDAAFNSGFNDLSYFCKVFKRHTHLTPKEYKKQHKTYSKK